MVTTYVECYINPHKSKVAPMMAIENIRIGLQELVCGPVCAVLAVVQSVWVCNVTARLVDEPAQVLLARQTSRWTNSHVFDG